MEGNTLRLSSNKSLKTVLLTSRITGAGILVLVVLAVAGAIWGLDKLATTIAIKSTALAGLDRIDRIATLIGGTIGALLTGITLGIAAHLFISRINGELFYRYAKTVDWTSESEESIQRAIFRLRHGGKEWDPLTRELERMVAVKREVHSDPTQ